MQIIEEKLFLSNFEIILVIRNCEVFASFQRLPGERTLKNTKDFKYPFWLTKKFFK